MTLRERLYEASISGNELAHEAVEEINRLDKIIKDLTSSAVPALLASKAEMLLGDEFTERLEKSIANARKCE